MAVGALTASCIGLTARRLLRPGADLTLFAAFSGAAHFVDPSGELLVLAGDAVAAPWAICLAVLPWHELARETGAQLSVSGDDPACLRLAGLAVDLAYAWLWESPPLGVPVCLEAVGAALRRAGLPPTAPGLAGYGAEPLVAALAEALFRGDPAAVAAAGAPLVGRGRGLTPAGDDLLTGVFGTLALAGRPCPLPPLAGRTTRLGATQLAHAATGALIEPLHGVIAALLAGQPPPQAELRRLLALGHSSGADMLAGAQLALAALAMEAEG